MEVTFVYGDLSGKAKPTDPIRVVFGEPGRLRKARNRSPQSRLTLGQANAFEVIGKRAILLPDLCRCGTKKITTRVSHIMGIG